MSPKHLSRRVWRPLALAVLLAGACAVWGVRRVRALVRSPVTTMTAKEQTT